MSVPAQRAAAGARPCGRLLAPAVLSTVLLVAASGGASAETEPPLPQVEFLSGGRSGAISAGAAQGNPLWAVPVESLSATRERPLFTPSRRPPAAAVETLPPPPVAGPVVAAPARPPLALMGTVVGSAGSFGIFADQGSGQVLRLRVGEAYSGWTLRSVGQRDVVMQAGADRVTLALPAPARGGPQPPRGPEGPFAAAQIGAGKPTARQVVVPRRSKPSPADLDSSH